MTRQRYGWGGESHDVALLMVDGAIVCLQSSGSVREAKYSRVATDYGGQIDRGCTCVSQQVTMNTVGNDRRVWMPEG